MHVSITLINFVVDDVDKWHIESAINSSVWHRLCREDADNKDVEQEFEPQRKNKMKIYRKKLDFSVSLSENQV